MGLGQACETCLSPSQHCALECSILIGLDVAPNTHHPSCSHASMALSRHGDPLLPACSATRAVLAQGGAGVGTVSSHTPLGSFLSHSILDHRNVGPNNDGKTGVIVPTQGRARAKGSGGVN